MVGSQLVFHFRYLLTIEEADLVDFAIRCPGKGHAVRFQLQDCTRGFFAHVVLSHFFSLSFKSAGQEFTYNGILIAEPV